MKDERGGTINAWKQIGRAGLASLWVLVGAVVPRAGYAPLGAQALGDLRPSWSPDGRNVAFQSTRDGNDEIYRIDVTSGRTIRLTDHIATDGQPSWSPDGSRIVFVSDRDRDAYSGRGAFQLYVMNVDGTGVSRLAETSSADFIPRWSPDGRWLAFLSDRTGPFRLYVMPSQGGDVRPALPDDFDAVPGNPTWSSDSRRIAFDAETDDGYEIYAVELESGRVAPLTRTEETEWYPVWSPDGSRIVVGQLTGTRSEGTHRLVALDVAAGTWSGITRPTPRSDHARDWWPSWSPDGSSLVFASRRSGPWRLFVVNADGSGERPLGRR